MEPFNSAGTLSRTNSFPSCSVLPSRSLLPTRVQVNKGSGKTSFCNPRGKTHLYKWFLLQAATNFIANSTGPPYANRISATERLGNTFIFSTNHKVTNPGVYGAQVENHWSRASLDYKDLGGGGVQFYQRCLQVEAGTGYNTIIPNNVSSPGDGTRWRWSCERGGNFASITLSVRDVLCSHFSLTHSC